MTQIVHPLKYPATLDDGRVVTEVVLHRLTAREVREFVEKVGRGEKVGLPMLDLSLEELDQLDDDDVLEIEKICEDFYPRRLRGAAAQASEAGGGTSPSSPESSQGSETPSTSTGTT